MTKRKGRKPAAKVRYAAEPSVLDQGKDGTDGFPVLSLRFVQKGWGVSNLSDSQCRGFLSKWEERCRITWKDLSQHPKHGLGSEFIPKHVIKPKIPAQFADVERFKVFRHEGNHALAGWKTQNVFHVIWIEAQFNDLYDHG